ncbi:ATP-dependent endonuclease [Brevibacillus laterosporus]|uniref:ATP-dependent endonuclease n=1 Tax=Brevibacillus laterosporus TaxID=1465 RepID=A0AAP8QF65_BRELA|nr:AAA family ATPase [Brevibacillus laterosporus]PPA87736.1 ATP-dependent endonuclease [Brevibacillus laterosporus]PPB08865.1 ATP-dependent endonuclease [Brevibacillus laterosporus]
MYISKLVIRNFRNFKNAIFHFQKGVNTLIGENSSGKTNAFEALRLLIDDSLPRNATKLSESDFNRDLNDWRGHWIIISILLKDLDTSEGSQILRHSIGAMDESNSGTYTMIFRPNFAIRKQLHQNSGDRELVLPILESLTIDEYETVYFCRGTADFSNEDVYKTYIGDFEQLIFPNPEILHQDILGSQQPNIFSFTNEVSCTYVKALRDVVSDFRNLRNNPLIHLLKEQSDEFKRHTHITEKIRELNETIADLGEIRELSTGIKQSLKNTIGITFAPSINIKSELPDDMEKLLYSLTLWVGDTYDGDYQGKIREMSLGGANLIYLSLKLLEYEYKKSTDKVAHFLLIEEPEAHIHTHIQKTLFERYHYQKTQVIITTHSTHISSASKIRSVNILGKGTHYSQIFHPSNGLGEEACIRIERYLDAVRSTLLFAKSVILVEGDAEMVLVPALIKTIFGTSLDELGISLINMSSTVFTNIASLFHEDRIQRKCSIITDLDTSIVDLPNDPKNDSDFVRDCRNSQIKGLERNGKLNEFCRNNVWISPFYAKYTFEVDFLLTGNAHTIEKCIEKIYVREHDKQESITKIKEQDVSICGKEILRLANKVGKGWFSLIVAENLKYDAKIPHYILEALAFSGDHITKNHMENMIVYRLGEFKTNRVIDEGLYQHYLQILKSEDIDGLIQEFLLYFHDDTLSAFIHLLGYK